MKRHGHLLWLLVCCVSATWAQTASPAPAAPAPPPADLAPLLASAPTADDLPDPALWLRRERVVRWSPDGLVRRTLTGTLIILRAGRPAPRIELGYFGAGQAIAVTTARVWQPTLGLLDLAKVSLQHEQVGPFDDVDHYWLAFPSVRPGAAVDFEVHIDDRQPSQPEGLSDLWPVAQPEPVALAIYRAVVPPGVHLASEPARFAEPVTVGSVEGNTQYTWVARDLAGGAATSLLVSGVPDWQAVAARFRQASDRAYTVHDALTTAVQREIAGQADPALALYRYVVTQIQYKAGGLETGAPSTVPRPATETFDLRLGDCKDNTVLLVTMLRAAGLAAYPALVRTLPRGLLVESVPAMAQFDHSIVAVPVGNGFRWFDPTWRFGPANYLPPDLHGVQALVVGEESAQWAVLPLPDAQANRRIREANLTLDAGGALAGTVTVRASGGFEQAMRRQVAAGGLGAVALALRQQLGLGVATDSVQATDPWDLATPFELSYSLSQPGYARGRRLLAVRLAVLERERLPSVLLAAGGGPVRLEVAPRQTEDTVRLTLDPALTVLELPAETGQKAAWGSWRVTYRQDGQAVVYQRTTTLNQPLLAESQASEALHWYQELVAADQDTFVIVERR